MTEKTPLEDLKPGDAIIIGHPASDAFVVARVINKTPRGARINYWSTQTGDWSEMEKIRFIEHAYLIAPGADMARAAADLLAAFTARHEALREVRAEHLRVVARIADENASVTA